MFSKIFLSSVVLSVVSRAFSAYSTSSPAVNCTLGPVDLVFVADGSGSVGLYDFQHVLRFLADLTTSLQIGSQVQVCLCSKKEPRQCPHISEMKVTRICIFHSQLFVIKKCSTVVISSGSDVMVVPFDERLVSRRRILRQSCIDLQYWGFLKITVQNTMFQYSHWSHVFSRIFRTFWD